MEHCISALNIAGNNIETELRVSACDKLARRFQLFGDYNKAKEWFEEAGCKYEPIRFQESICLLGDCYRELKLFSSADTCFSMISGNEFLLADKFVYAATFNNWGWSLREQNRLKEAREKLEISNRINERFNQTNNDALAQSMGNLASVLWILGEQIHARKMIESALEIRLRSLGEKHRRTAITMMKVSALLRTEGKLDEAEEYGKKALSIYRELLGSDHPDTAFAHFTLGIVMLYRENFNEAVIQFKKVNAVRTTVFGVEYLWNAHAWLGIGWALLGLRQTPKAQKWFESVGELITRYGQGFSNFTQSVEWSVERARNFAASGEKLTFTFENEWELRLLTQPFQYRKHIK